MRNSNGHKMVVLSFLISKPEQVYHFQMRLPRNAKQVVAIDYDVMIKSVTNRAFLNEVAVVASAVISQSLNTISIANPKEQPISINAETIKTNSIQFNWTSKQNPVIGNLKLQSFETANIFYKEWIKLLEWNNGLTTNSLFPNQATTLLQKQYPLCVEVSPQTTMINGLYEDVLLTKTNKVKSYEVKVFVWLEMKEPSNGVEYEFLKPKTND